MAISKKVTNFITNILSVTSVDADDARRRRLLNVLLLGFFVTTFVLVILTGLYVSFVRFGVNRQDTLLIYFISLCLFVGSLVVYIINRYKSGPIAAQIFLLFLQFAFIFSDSAEQVANGRSLLIFSIPIVMASMLLRPNSSFIFAALSSLEIIGLALVNDIPPNIPAIATFFMLAVVSWLSARSLENALRELRTTNANLDRLVAERTSALAESLARERIEAGRNIAILESIADGVIVFDIHGKAIVVNPATTQLLNLPRDQIIKSSIKDLIRARALDARNRKNLSDLLSNPGQRPANYRVQWGKKTFSVSSAQVYDTEETRIGTVAVFHDFTHEAEIEKMKDTILAIVSHELRTPLNAILGYVEMLKEAVYGPINEKQARASERVISNTRRLLSIVSDLLDQAQIEAGKITIQVQPLKTSELLEYVHGIMDKAAADKHLTLVSESTPGFPEILNGDAARLQQILVNLVGNAIKFTEKGSVHICLSCLDKKHWAMEVQDSGMGIPENELTHIFEPFKRVDDSIIRKQAGFGLGLSIVKQLVNLMDGDITVKSNVGVGSAFTVTLPILSIGGKTA